MENCPCPEDDVITSIPEIECPENLGAIYKAIFTKRTNAISATAAAAILKATYDTKLAAVNDTKIVISPPLENLVIPPGDFITEGGDDNSTPLGRQIVVGFSTIIVTGMMRNIQSAIVAAMRQLRCFDLSVAFVNEFGQIAFDHRGVPAGPYYGFPLHAFAVGDKGNEGKNTQDKANIRWGFDAGWRDNLIVFKPTAFDPRFDLVNP